MHQNMTNMHVPDCMPKCPYPTDYSGNTVGIPLSFPAGLCGSPKIVTISPNSSKLSYKYFVKTLTENSSNDKVAV